jgi:hypothetical protein
MSAQQQNADALLILHDFVERATHWREGGATRHDALLALGRLGVDVPKPFKPRDSASDEYTPTSRLRFITRNFVRNDETGVSCFAGTTRVLQQLFVSLSGAAPEEWRDVPSDAEETVNLSRTP